jgi:hypothetical protein
VPREAAVGVGGAVVGGAVVGVGRAVVGVGRAVVGVGPGVVAVTAEGVVRVVHAVRIRSGPTTAVTTTTRIRRP